jgi:hypothetical protein
MRYIQNIHTAPITAVVKNAKGEAVLTKKFYPARTDKFTGQVEATGFTPLTDEEYNLLNERSKTFTVYRDKHHLLVEHDELPPEAKTPHEALVDARREARKAADRIAALAAEVVQLKAGLLDAERKYKDLFDAGNGEIVDALRKENEELKAALENAIAEHDAAIAVLEANMAEALREQDEREAAAEKSGKDGKGKGKEFD